MRKVAVSVAIGLFAGLALVGAYIGAPYAGIHPDPALAIVVAAALAFGSSTALFAQTALGKPVPKPKGSELLGKKIRDLDAGFVTAFPSDGTGTLRLVIKPDTRIDLLDVVKNGTSYENNKILVTFRKSSDKNAVFNPIPLKQLFLALKDKANFLHVLLVDDHDEYVGYIPAFYARSNFTGDNAETMIRRYIIDVLAGSLPSDTLRSIGGLGSNDWISNEEKVASAMKRMADGLLRGLVVLRGGRHRQPIAVIYADDLIRATTPVPG
jgi:hypothetical protein